MPHRETAPPQPTSTIHDRLYVTFDQRPSRAALSLFARTPSVKGFLDGFNKGGTLKRNLQQKKNPGSLGGATRGGGIAEGGRRKLVLDLVHLVYGQHANLSQLFVREIR